MNDIYFEKGYGILYEKIEGGKVDTFEFKNEFGTIKHMFIKREIPTKIENRKYYDIITPNGYGGPIIVNCLEGYRDVLVEAFYSEFKKYCIQSEIVTEFIRFHPIVENAYDFKNIYQIEHIRNTVGTNLILHENPFESEFSKSCKKNIKRSLNSGVEYKINLNPIDLNKFIEIYHSTMERNSASDFYYYGEEYFENCINFFRKSILTIEAIFESKTIAMGLYLLGNKTIHIHLSGTLSEYLSYSPAYVLRYAATLWGKENGYEYIHHGGGRTNSPDDNLYKFKKQFGKSTEFKFFTGRKIWNDAIYLKLNNLNDVENNGNVDFFPLYRLNEVK